MSMDYNSWLRIMGQLLLGGATIDPQGDAAFMAMTPRMIESAEQRIYREADLLTTVTRDSSVAFTANNRTIALPTNPHFVTVQNINVITPAGSAPDAGTRNPLTQTTESYLDTVWSSSTGATLPTHVATLSDQTFLVGPWPDANYTVEFIGTIRPTPLSPTNTTTYLTLYLPDLFVAACMIFGAAYQRDFGSMSDNPQLALDWSQQYDKLFASTNIEENKKRWAGGAWSAMGQAPTATQSRGGG